MNISSALGLYKDSKEMVISFVGGGGKTSCIFSLAYELANEGNRLLITTTTAMYNPEKINHPNISVLGDYVTPEGKLKGISKEKVDDIKLGNQFDFILVEADGSKGRPIKAPADHEPVIAKSTDIMIGVIGMDAFGQKLDSAYVHRSEILADLTKTPIEGIVKDKVILHLVSNPMGLFKNCPPSSRKILLLNKVVDEKRKEIAMRIGYNILEACNTIDTVLIGAVQEQDPIKERLQR